MTDLEHTAPHAGRLLDNDLTPAAVAEQLHVTRATLATWRSSGRGPAYRKVGRNVTYPEAEVRAWLDRQIVRMGNGRNRPQVVQRPAPEGAAWRPGVFQNKRFRRHRTKEDIRNEMRSRPDSCT